MDLHTGKIIRHVGFHVAVEKRGNNTIYNLFLDGKWEKDYNSLDSLNRDILAIIQGSYKPICQISMTLIYNWRLKSSYIMSNGISQPENIIKNTGTRMTCMK